MLASGVLDAGSGLWGEDCSCGERDAGGGGGGGRCVKKDCGER